MKIQSSDIPSLPLGLRRAIERARGKLDLSESVPMRRPWSNAKPTERDGIRFASKTEAGVYERLLRELGTGERIYLQVRLPLLASAPTTKRRALYFTVDFLIVKATGAWRLVDAKTRRVSREWARGKAACEATYGVTIEETDR